MEFSFSYFEKYFVKQYEFMAFVNPQAFRKFYAANDLSMVDYIIQYARSYVDTSFGHSTVRIQNIDDVIYVMERKILKRCVKIEIILR